jgi:hypothetical protein
MRLGQLCGTGRGQVKASWADDQHISRLKRVPLCRQAISIQKTPCPARFVKDNATLLLNPDRGVIGRNRRILDYDIRLSVSADP